MKATFEAHRRGFKGKTTVTSYLLRIMSQCLQTAPLKKL